MSEQQQNLANHAKTPMGIIYVTGILLVGLGLALAGSALFSMQWEYATFLIGLGTAVVGVATAITALVARFNCLMLQDRLIRLEMRVRLAQVLPPDLASRAGSLNVDQLIALRFASDAELPELVREVLDKNIQERAEIKKRVKNWQADFMRV